MKPSLIGLLKRTISISDPIVSNFIPEGPWFLTYHGVGEDDHSISLSTDQFQRHLEILRESEYTVLSLTECLAQGCPKKSVVITFDDGTYGQYLASKILEDFGFQGVFFITSGYIHESGYMTREQVEELSQSHEVGAHTSNHLDLGTIDDKYTIYREVIEARKRLEALVDSPINHFAFPYGKGTNLKSEVFKAAEEAGYETICSTTGMLPGRYQTARSLTLIERSPINDMMSETLRDRLRGAQLTENLIREILLDSAGRDQLLQKINQFQLANQSDGSQ